MIAINLKKNIYIIFCLLKIGVFEKYHVKKHVVLNVAVFRIFRMPIFFFFFSKISILYGQGSFQNSDIFRAIKIHQNVSLDSSVYGSSENAQCHGFISYCV